jgi:hypothetical protein
MIISCFLSHLPQGHFLRGIISEVWGWQLRYTAGNHERHLTKFSRYEKSNSFSDILSFQRGVADANTINSCSKFEV